MADPTPSSLHIGECLSSLSRGEILLLSAEETVSPLFMERRQAPSLYKKGSLSFTEERAPVFSIVRRETSLLCREERVSLPSL